MRRPDWFDWTAGTLAIAIGLTLGAECWWRIGGFLLNDPGSTGFRRLIVEYGIDGLTVLGASLTFLGILLHHRAPSPSRARLATNPALVDLKVALVGLAVWFVARLAIFAATPLREFPLWTLWYHPCLYAAVGVVVARSLLGMAGVRRRPGWCERLAWWVGTGWILLFGLKVYRQFL